MAIARQYENCIHCGEPLTPVFLDKGKDFVGDTFSGWYEPCKCGKDSLPAPGDKGGEEAAGNGFLESLRSSIQHFKKEGKGEFAAGILLAVNRYKDFAARWQQSLPTEGRGVRWVKADFHNPPNSDLVHLKYSTGKTSFKATGYYDAGIWYHQNGNILDWHPNLEWLDEFPSAPEQRSDAVEFTKWVHNNGYKTAGWDDGQLERIYVLFTQSKLPAPPIK